MRTFVSLLAAVLLLFPVAAQAQDSRAALESVAKALGMTVPPRSRAGAPGGDGRSSALPTFSA